MSDNNSSSSEAANASFPGELSDSAAQQIANSCTARSQLWALAARVLEPPSRQYVESLRGGEFLATLEEATGFLGEGAPQFADFRLLLGVVQRRSARASAAAEEKQLSTEFSEAFPPHSEIEALRQEAVTLAEESRRACAAESAAWLEGDVEEARRLRRTQTQRVDTIFAGQYEQWMDQLNNLGAGAYPRAVIIFLWDVISVETGRKITIPSRRSRR